jgi:hypothetical protein
MDQVTVRMTQTRPGAPDGVNVEIYEAGEVYDLPTRLAVPFVREGWAERVKGVETKIVEPPETQTIEPDEVKADGGIGLVKPTVKMPKTITRKKVKK